MLAEVRLVLMGCIGTLVMGVLNNISDLPNFAFYPNAPLPSYGDVHLVNSKIKVI